MWLVRNKERKLFLFNNKPIRENETWVSDSEGFFISDEKVEEQIRYMDISWYSEPYEIDIYPKGIYHDMEVSVCALMHDVSLLEQEKNEIIDRACTILSELLAEDGEIGSVDACIKSFKQRLNML